LNQIFEKEAEKHVGRDLVSLISMRLNRSRAGQITPRVGVFQILRRIALHCLALAVATVGSTGIAPAQAPSGAAHNAQQNGTSVFIGVTVIPMGSPQVLHDQVVLVRGTRIAEVGPRKSTHIPAAARRIDGRGLFLIPGLADMHVHLMQGETYFPLFLANGVTTVRNMAGGPEMLDLRERVEKGAVLGPTVYTAGPLVDGSPPVWGGSDIVDSPDQARSVVEKQKATGYDFIKAYDNLRPTAYEAVVQAAASANMRLAGHVPPVVGLQRVLNAHQWSIEHLTGYFEWLQNDSSPFRQIDEKETFHHPAHLLAKRQGLVDWLDMSRLPQIAAATAKAGTWNVPTLVAWRNMTPHPELDAAWKRPNMRYATSMLHEWWSSDTGYTAEDFAAKERGDAARNQILKALHDAGARLLVGTDTPHPFVMPGFSVHEELGNFVAVGLSPYEAVKAATSDAAEFMGIPGEFGTIKPGARADLVLVAGNPLDDINNTKRIVGVMVRGHWLPRDELQRELDSVSMQSAKGRK
jgi:imidazolonepropionase-like amidohydrolase